MDPLFPNRTLFRSALEALRQPLETGRVSVARANAHVAYPARVQLVAAMNPCRCGYLDDPGRACARAPRCAARSEEHTSELPSLMRISYAVFCLKKKHITFFHTATITKTLHSH